MTRPKSLGGRPKHQFIDGGVLRRARVAKCLTRSDLVDLLAARGCVVSASSLTNYELGRSFPSERRLAQICDALGVSMADVVPGGPRSA